MKKVCRKYRCEEPPFLGGLCEEHHNEEVVKKERERKSLEVLYKCTVEGGHITNKELFEELRKLQHWWDKARFSVNNGVVDDHLKDEAEFALSWCQSLAAEISIAEIAYREGRPSPTSLEHTREWVWHRFNNLEQGLKSNGIKRNK